MRFHSSARAGQSQQKRSLLRLTTKLKTMRFSGQRIGVNDLHCFLTFHAPAVFLLLGYVPAVLGLCAVGRVATQQALQPLHHMCILLSVLLLPLQG